LAQNWDVDLSSCLNDYLNELNQLGHAPQPGTVPGLSQSGDGAPPNFAHAALLLQNSSCVYGRKVEYLHSLVYTVLNDLMNSTAANANAKEKRKSRAGGDGVLDELNAADPDCMFLPLDDVLPTDESEGNGKINLVEDEDDLDETLGGDSSGRASSGNDLSLGGLDVTRLDRTSLGGSGGSGGGVGASVNKAALERSLAGLLTEGSDANGGNLRLLSGKCDVGRDGALLMPGSSLINGGQYKRRSSMGRFSRGSHQTGFGVGAEGEQGDEGPGLIDFGANNDFDDGVDVDDDGGVGFQLADPDDEHGEEKKDDDPLAEEEEVAAHSQEAGSKTVQFADPAPVPAEEKPDPWHLLDPHDTTTVRARPLRVGITIRLPPGVDDRPSAYVNGTRTKRSDALRERLERTREEKREQRRRDMVGMNRCLAAEAFDNAMGRARKREEENAAAEEKETDGEGDDDKEGEEGSQDGSQDGKDILNETATAFFSDPKDLANADADDNEEYDDPWKPLPTKGFIFGNEFAYVAKATAKVRAAQRREEHKKRAEDEALAAAGGSAGPIAAVSLAAAATAAVEQDDFDDDEDYGSGFQFAGDDDHSVGEGDEHQSRQGNSALGSLDEAFGAAAGPLGLGDGDDHAADELPKTFEELCRAHVEAFARGAERYASETHLTKRVGDWQSRLLPILEEEEERPDFDIHRYGERILGQVKDEVRRKRSLSVGKMTGIAEAEDQENRMPDVDDAISKRGTKTPQTDEDDSEATKVSFVNVMEGAERYEVCRLFLSSLMLCNSGNILLGQTDREPDDEAAVATPDTLRVKLLDGDMNRPMQSYLAPSAQEATEDDNKENKVDAVH